MSDVSTDQYEVIEPLDGADLEEVFQPSSGGLRREKKATLDEKKAFYKGTTKVLWTGPLAVVSTPASLDGAEKFSDWDRIEVHFSLFSDTSTFAKTPFTVDFNLLNDINAYSDTGVLVFNKLSDTSFQINTKTVALGNIQRIIGISL